MSKLVTRTNKPRITNKEREKAEGYVKGWCVGDDDDQHNDHSGPHSLSLSLSLFLSLKQALLLLFISEVRENQWQNIVLPKTTV